MDETTETTTVAPAAPAEPVKGLCTPLASGIVLEAASRDAGFIGQTANDGSKHTLAEVCKGVNPDLPSYIGTKGDISLGGKKK